MATITSSGTGNFSAGGTWVGGVVPGADDVAIVATGHTVTITGNVTCQELRKEGSGTTHNGNFVLGGTHTITANITNACTGPGGSTLVNFTLNSGTATIIGNITAGFASSQAGVVGAGTGALVVTGNVTGGTGSGTHGVSMTGATAQLTVTGNATGGSSGVGVSMTGVTAQLTVTGNATGGAGSSAIQSTGTSAQLTFTGNATGGSSTSSSGIAMTGTTSNADIVGDITASTTSHGVVSSGQVVLDGNFVDAANGRSSHTAAFRRVRVSTNVLTQYTTPEPSNANGTPVIRASLDYVTTNVPVPADVREGIVYADDQFTGELAVPPVEAVAAGTPVDDTVGVAVLSIDVIGALFEAFEA